MFSRFTAAGAFLAMFAMLAGAIRPTGTSFGVPGKNATFDYIVVGGGNAGLTIAARLAEAQSGSVAVVEAGTFYEIGNGNQSQVPGLDNNYISKDPDDWHPLIDWGYVTCPQKVCTNMKSVCICLDGSNRWDPSMHSMLKCTMHEANALAARRQEIT